MSRFPTTLRPTRDRAVLLADRGYLFTSALDAAERRRLARDGATELRFLGRRALLVTGTAGVSLFYDADRLARRRAMPAAVARVLFGPGAVHGLDDAEHVHRKALFLDLLTPQACCEIAQRARGEWEERSRRWAADLPLAHDGHDGHGGHDVYGGDVDDNVFDAAVDVFGRGCSAGPGRPPTTRPPSLATWRRSWTASAASVRPTSRLVQRGCGRTAGRGAACGRPVRPAPTSGCPPRARRCTAWPPRATSRGRCCPSGPQPWSCSTCCVRLSQWHGWRPSPPSRSSSTPTPGGGCRRVSGRTTPARPRRSPTRSGARPPFVPLLAARARRDFTWNGFSFRAGQRVLLDVHGTDHGPAWEDPRAFRPDRFLDADPMTLAAFVPQGGGRPEAGHRCPGEGVATALVVETLRVLVDRELAPLPDVLVWSPRRMPTRPPSGVRIGAPLPGTASLRLAREH